MFEAFLPFLGAYAGFQKDKVEASSSQESGIRLNPASGLENYGYGLSQGSLSALQNLFNLGPGAGDVTAGVNAQRDLASLLQSMSASGGLPGQNDISTANRFAGDIFQARRLGLEQNFQDQITMANRQAAAMGRDINDPVLRAKMMEEQTRQQNMLGAEQNAYAAQFALSLPGQRLGYAAQRADLLAALGAQAQQNQATLFGLGQQALGNERQFRLSTGTQWGTGNQTQLSGGGLKGAMTGFLGTTGALMSLGGQAVGIANGLPMGGGASQPFGQAMPPQQLQMPQFGSQYSAGPRNFNFGPMGSPAPAPMPAPSPQFGPWASGLGYNTQFGPAR